MSEQELEEQVEGSAEMLEDDTGEITESPDVPNKNKSNWKEMSKALKAEREARAKAEAELAEWRSLNPEIDLSEYRKESSDDIRTELFLIKNPEAEEYMDKLSKFTDKGFSLKEAWDYVKPTIPKESQTEKDFDIKSKWTSKKVDLSKVTFEEIYSWDFTAEQKREWRNLHE